MVDLSLAGAGVEVGKPLVPGTQVRLEIVAPTLWDPLVLRGRTVWSGAATSPARAGLAFEHDDRALVYALFELMGAHGYEV